MNWLFSFFFGCFHKRTTWPITIKGQTHVACLECGERIPYNWDTMKLGDSTPTSPAIQEEMGR